MASIVNDPGGRRRVQFEAADGRRKTIRLGKVSLKDAQEVLMHVDRLASAQMHATTPPVSTSGWLATIGDKLHGRIAAAGLCVPRAKAGAVSLTLRIMLDDYKSRRRDVNAATLVNWGHTFRNLFEFFGDGRDPRTITQGEAEDFKRHLIAAGLSTATVGKRVKNAKQFFADALSHELISRNPFEKVKGNAGTNRNRMAFIRRPIIQKVIDACPDEEWKLLLVLSRYEGLRCPSEHLALRWGDVDWEAGTLRVRGKGDRVRTVPIFPEVRPYLEAAFDRGEPGELHVITRYRQSNVNLRTQLERIMVRAGVTPWPKIFHNLRASCETELANAFPLHVVCEWIGNSEAVARDHYLQVTDQNFSDASDGQQKATLNPTLQDDATAGNERQPASLLASDARNIAESSDFQAIQVGPVGFEQSSKKQGHSHGSGAGDAGSDARQVDPGRDEQPDGKRLDSALGVIRGQAGRMK